MTEILVPVLVFVGTVAVGGAVVAARAARTEPLHARLRGLEMEPTAAPPRRSRLAEALGWIGRFVASGGTSRPLGEELNRAGFHGEAAPVVYLGAKVLLAAVGLLGFVAIAMPMEIAPALKTSGAMLAAGALFFVPNVFVRVRRHQRSAEVRRALPDAVDLLEVCVSAGMGLDMAWNVVSDEIRRVSPVLGDEMALTNLEIHLGAPRVEAMRHLAERTGVSEIGSLVAVLVQSERFGTNVADALGAFTGSMRETRGSIAAEAAEKMAVRLIFPMVLFVFPAIFVVTVGPAAITLIDVFRR